MWNKEVSYNVVDWQQVRSVLEGYVSMIKSELALISNEHKDRLECVFIQAMGVWPVIRIGFLHQHRNRRFYLGDNSKVYYENLTEKELALATQIMTEISKRFPDLDFEVIYRSSLDYKVRLKRVPKLHPTCEVKETLSTSAQRKINFARVKGRVEQVLRANRRLSLSWEPDLAMISELADLPLPEVEKFAKRYVDRH